MSNGRTVAESIPLTSVASPQVRAVEADVEEVPLDMVPGLANDQSYGAGGVGPACCCSRQHYRTLAICSIICGCTCIGYHALISSVKAEGSRDPEAAERFSRRAKKLSICAIVTWYTILVAVFLLVVLISYLVTFIN